MEKEHLPIFKIDIKPIYNESSLKEDNLTDYLEIENVGEPISEVDIRDLVLIKITNKLNGLFDYSPVRNYYVIIPESGYNNRWHTIGGEGNFFIISEIKKNISLYFKSPLIDPQITFERYLKITYRDKIGLLHSDYFFLSENGSKKLDNNEGLKIEEIYNSKLDRLVVLPQISIDKTMKKLDLNWN
jgi:hypothetical protein